MLIRSLSLALIIVMPLWIAAGALAEDEVAWVGGNRQLNLRTGAREGDRRIGVLNTGDKVVVLRRDGGWTQVRDERSRTGWVLGTYLQNEPPLEIRLGQQVEALQAQLDAAEQKNETLGLENQSLKSETEKSAELMSALERENMEFRAGERWPFLITGAAILVGGMFLGVCAHWVASRRGGRGKIRF